MRFKVVGLFFLLTLLSTKTFATVLDQPCSGKVSDLACHRDIIKAEARRLNQREKAFQGPLAPTPIKSMSRMTLQGQKILIDRQDVDACQELQSFLRTDRMQAGTKSETLADLCRFDDGERFKEITLMWETDEEYFTEVYLNRLKDTDQNLVNDTRNVVFAMGATLGALWMAPESFSNFNKEELRKQNIWQNWSDHVSHKPVRDKDGNLLNYVIHPIAGSIYYNIARTNGRTPMQSFGYSVMMSTFFWEYGFEATVEKPSIQDLIATPVLGSILGEVSFQLANEIEQNGSRAFGSKKVGKLLMFVLNPGRTMSDMINNVLGSKVIQSSQTHVVMGRKKDPVVREKKQNYIGFQIGYNF